MSELPKGWINTQIGQVITLNEKLKGIDDEIECGFVPMALMPTAYRGFVNFETKTWGSCKKGFTQFKDDDVLLAKITPCFENGKGGIVTGLPNGIGAGSTEYFVLRCIDELIQPQFLHAFVKSKKFMDDCEVHMGGSVGHKRVPKDYLLKYEIPLAPLNEQIRIANKLDSILAKVDKAQARLDKIPAILKRFRQSVLAAATSGELTKEWREASSGLNEALADYADKIENGRFDSWVQSKLREFEKKGKLPQNDKWKEKYSCKRSNLEPEGRVEEWNYESLDYLADVIDPNPKHRNPKYFEEGCHFISTAQFDGYDDFDLSSCKFVALDTIEEQKERCNFSPRSIAVSRKGTIGETRILDLDFPFALLDSVCVVNIDKAISHRYLNYALRGEWVQKQIYSKTKGVALKQVSVGAVRELVIPIPIYFEQREIVNKLDYMLSKAVKVEKQYLDAKARLDRLTQSILAKAFRGELVPQDQNDEPAEKLLERIVAEKEQNKPKKVTRKRTTKAKTAEKE